MNLVGDTKCIIFFEEKNFFSQRLKLVFGFLCAQQRNAVQQSVYCEQKNISEQTQITYQNPGINHMKKLSLKKGLI